MTNTGTSTSDIMSDSESLSTLAVMMNYQRRRSLSDPTSYNYYQNPLTTDFCNALYWADKVTEVDNDFSTTCDLTRNKGDVSEIRLDIPDGETKQVDKKQIKSHGLPQIPEEPSATEPIVTYPPPDYLNRSILYCFFCCWTMGVIAIQKSLNTRKAIAAENKEEALKYSVEAKAWSQKTLRTGRIKIGFVVGAAIFTGVILLLVFYH